MYWQKYSSFNFWIIIGIYLSIFVNSIVFFQQPFEFYLGYLSFILLLPIFVIKYGINKSLFFIFLVLLIIGLISIFSGNNTSAQFIKVFIGLTLSYFFYYYVVVKLNYGIEQLFVWYLKGAYIVSFIGFIQFISFHIGFRPGYDYSWLLNKWGFYSGGNFGIRVNSILGEPTYFAALLSTAFFIAVYNIFSKTPFFLTKKQSWIIIISYVLSFSGLGQVGIFLTFMFLILSFGMIRYLFVLIPLMFLVFTILYNNVDEFKGRYDGMVSLFYYGEAFELGKTHGSSYILYNNYTVALKNFTANPLFGGGLGSHVTAFDKFSLAKYFLVKGFDYNGQDASSMFLRLMSETGLFGLGIFFYIIIKGYVKRDENNLTYHWLISNAILIMILLNLFRQGHYFLNGFPFFVILYYYNSVSYKNYIEEQNLIST